MELGDFRFGELKVIPSQKDEFGRCYVGKEIIVQCMFVQDPAGKKLSPFEFYTVFDENPERKDRFGVFVYKHAGGADMIWNKDEKEWQAIQLNEYPDIQKNDFLEVMEFDKETMSWQAKVLLMAEPPAKDNGEEIYRYRESGPVDRSPPRSPRYFFRFYFEHEHKGQRYKGLSGATDLIEISGIESIFKAAVWSDNYLNPTYIEMFLRNRKDHEGFLRFDNTEGDERRVGITLEGQDSGKQPLNRLTFDALNRKGEIKLAGNLHKTDQKTMLQMNAEGGIDLFTLLEDSESTPYKANRISFTKNQDNELTLNLSNRDAQHKCQIVIKDDGTLLFNGEGNVEIKGDVKITGNLDVPKIKERDVHDYDPIDYPDV